MTIQRCRLIAAFILVCLFSNLDCHADVIVVGNIASATSYLNGYNVSSGGGINNSIVQGFTMTDSLMLTGADLYLQGFVDNSGPSIALAIYADNGSLRPSSTKLYDLSPTTLLTNSPGLVHFEGSGNLSAGVTYWLNLYSTNPGGANGDVIQWMRAVPGTPSGTFATYMGEIRSIGAGNPPTGAPEFGANRTAFQITGNIVSTPEPSSIIMAGLAFIMFGWRHLRVGRKHTLVTMQT